MHLIDAGPIKAGHELSSCDEGAPSELPAGQGAEEQGSPSMHLSSDTTEARQELSSSDDGTPVELQTVDEQGSLGLHPPADSCTEEFAVEAEELVLSRVLDVASSDGSEGLPCITPTSSAAAAAAAAQEPAPTPDPSSGGTDGADCWLSPSPTHRGSSWDLSEGNSGAASRPFWPPSPPVRRGASSVSSEGPAGEQGLGVLLADDALPALLEDDPDVDVVRVPRF